MLIYVLSLSKSTKSTYQKINDELEIGDENYVSMTE